jgi:4-amino-4-deoxy-L-arabinose transferase-like glycosyltransferase
MASARFEGQSPTRTFLLAAVLCFVWIYGYRISTNPLVWEEPRRCLVAMEMIERGDYVVPRLLGEVYRNKPPLQNWLLVLFSGNRVERVGAVPLRLISLLAIAGTAILLRSFCRTPGCPEPGWAPALVFVSIGIVMQYGRTGEVDGLFAFWVAASLWSFETGRRKRSLWRQWFLSQALLAPGILTKGISPLFFYPPVLWLAVRSRRDFPFSLKAFLAGLAAEVCLVAAWLVPYSSAASLTSLGRNLWSGEVMSRTPFASTLGALLEHLLAFPFEVLGSLLPWSGAALLWLAPGIRSYCFGRIRENAALRLCLAMSFWGFVLFWFMPGAKGRYLIPVYPFLSVLIALTLESASIESTSVILKLPAYASRFLNKLFVEGWTGWASLGLFWAGALGLVRATNPNLLVAQPLAAGLFVVAAGGWWVRKTSSLRILQALLLCSLLYGTAYAGLVAVHRAQKQERSLEPVAQILRGIQEDLPVVCGRGINRGGVHLLAVRLGRVPRQSPPDQGAYYLIGSISEPAGAEGSLVAEVPPLALWRVARQNGS